MVCDGEWEYFLTKRKICSLPRPLLPHLVILENWYGPCVELERTLVIGIHHRYQKFASLWCWSMMIYFIIMLIVNEFVARTVVGFAK